MIAMRALAWTGVFVLLGCAGGGGPAETTPPTTPSTARGGGAPQDEARPGRSGPGGSESGGAGHFPSPQELDQIEAAPIPERIFNLDVRRVDAWELEGPFPERAGAVPFATPAPAGEPTVAQAWQALLDDSARRRAGLVLPTTGMHCVARELGRFFLAHRGRPGQSLERFLAARCNTSVQRIGLAWVNGDVPERTDDVTLYGSWRTAVTQSLEQSLAGGPRTAGIWFGRSDGHAVVMVAFGYRDVNVEPFVPVPDADGRVAIAGEALSPAASVDAVLNRGRFGYARCEPDAKVRLPRFRFVCEVDPGDDTAYVTLSVHPPDRLLGRNVYTGLLRRANADARGWRRPSAEEPWVSLDPEQVPGDYVALLNRVRKRAGLAPLELDGAQSASAAELAPHFFAALLGHSGLETDLIVLGLMAGWHVDGIVQDARFAAGWAVQSNDLSELLANTLEVPNGRATLLDASAERIAVGPVLDTTEGRRSIGVVIGTYALFSGRAHEEAATRVYERLERERAARGRGKPERLTDIAYLCQEAAAAVQAGEDPREVMAALLDGSNRLLRRPVVGWVAEARNVDEFEFPEEYLTDRLLDVAVAVAHRKVEGEAWGRYVLMLVVAEPEARGA